MTNVISFCLWGNSSKYCVGAVRNAELAPIIYPGWECWFYVADSVPKEYIDQLSGFNHVKLIPMPTGFEGWRGMTARFLPISNSDIETTLIRDCDSRLNEREVVAVNQWLKSNYKIHVIRDHPYHTTPILGGLWGAKKCAIVDFDKLIYQYVKGDYWQVDQELLCHIVWPYYYNTVLAHDNWGRFREAVTINFPTPRIGKQFCGEIFDEFDNPNLEHRNLI